MRTNRRELLEILAENRGPTIEELESAMKSQPRVRTSLRHAIRAGAVEVRFDGGRRRYRYYVAAQERGDPLRGGTLLEVVA